MIVICPKCSSKFVVKADMIGAKGRKVRCSKCKEQWLQSPDKKALQELKKLNIAKTPNKASPMKKGANVPSIQREKTSILKIASFSLATIILLFAISFANIIALQDKYPSYYNAIFGENSKGLAFYDIKINKIDLENHRDIFILGKVVNESSKIKDMPKVRLAIFDKNNEAIQDIIFELQDEKINPNQAIEFQNKISNIPFEAEKIAIDLGNSVELYSR